MTGHLPLTRDLEVFPDMEGLDHGSSCPESRDRVSSNILFSGFITSHDNLHSGISYYLFVTAVFL